jgi:hypothetical protein
MPFDTMFETRTGPALAAGDDRLYTTRYMVLSAAASCRALKDIWIFVDDVSYRQGRVAATLD